MNSPKRQKIGLDQKGPKRNFSNYKKKFLEVGQRGFLATCNFREKDCVRECYNILNQYADELYGPQEVPAPLDGDVSPETGDIADDLQKQIDAENRRGKDAAKKRFQMVETGTTNCVFIRTTLPDPVELGTHIVKDIARTGSAKSRYLLRLVPIEAVCKANVSAITAAGGALFDKHFLKEATTFAIVFNKRYNNDLKRDDVIHDLAAVVHEKNAGNSVDLKQSAKTVVVEVIKGLCCLSVVDGYLKHKKYNLVELANAKTATVMAGKDAENNTEDKTDDTKNAEQVTVPAPTKGDNIEESKKNEEEDNAEAEPVL